MANLGPQYQNLTYGSLLQIPGGVTDQLQTVTDGNGNNTGLLISSTGISIPGLVTTNAQNLNGGSIGSLPYQSGVSTTSFVSAGTPGQVLLSSGTSAPFWANSVPTALLKAGDTMTGTLSMGANNITNLATPVLATDAATKNYVDSVAVGINVKTSCAAATTANITLSGAQTIDGVSVVAGNRVLVKNQTAPADNGIYVASASAWTRATDADTWAELIGAMVFISAGTINGLTSWISNTTSGGTIGVTAVTFVQFGASQSYTAGTGITLSGNQFSLTTPVTVSSGGTGVSSLTGVPWGNGGSAMTVATGAQLSGQMAGVGAANQLLQSNGASAPTWTSTPRGTSFQFNGSVANSVTINAGTSPASQTYSLPAAYPGSTGQVLSSTTGGAMSWASIATTSGQSILAGNNSGGFQNVTLSGLSYNTGTSTLSVTSSASSTVINVADYGASPSASASTNTTAIQAAINAAPSQGATIVFPPASGYYSINGTINLNKQKIIIDGQGATIGCTTNASAFYVTAWNCFIRNITIDGTGTTFTATTYAIDTGYLTPANQAAQYLTISYVNINKCGSGIRLRSAYFWVISCQISGCLVSTGIGININAVTSTGITYADIIGFITDTLIDGNTTGGRALSGIKWTSGFAPQITSCELVGSQYALDISPVVGAVENINGGALSLKCVNTFFDSPGASAVIFRAINNSTNTGTLPISFVSFVGCWFGNANYQYGIYFEPGTTVYGLVISGCEVYGAVSGFVFGNNCVLKAINISGCNISCTTTGVDVGNNCANININSNYIGTSNPGSGAPIYPVYFNPGANNIVMTGNRLNANYSGGAPSNSVIANNLVAA